MVLCKNDEAFRETQRFLDSNVKKYTTLYPKERRPKKVCIEGLLCYADSELIIHSIKKYEFTVTKTATLKNRKTGKK